MPRAPNTSQSAERVQIYLVGMSEPAAVKGLSAADRQNFAEGMQRALSDKHRELKEAALAEARLLLKKIPEIHDVWSHAFHFEGRRFLLSVYRQPARQIRSKQPLAGFVPGVTKVLPPRLLIEVSPAPSGLTNRTILRPHRTDPRPHRTRLEAAE